MQVILLERVENLGQMGDVVKVKNGYARNYLLPQKKALRATDGNKVKFESQRAQLEVRNLERRKEAETVAERLNGQSFVAIRQAGEGGQLYGSVTGRDIADIVTEGGFSVSRSQIRLLRPIKTIGLVDIRIALHPEVSVQVTLNVARSDEEAERQARGEVLLGPEVVAEEPISSAAEVFESEELAEAARERLAEETGGPGDEGAAAGETASDDEEG